MAWNAARSVGTQACRTLFKWGFCVPEKYIVKVNTFTYSRWGLGPPRKSIPSAPVSELNPGRSWEPTELVEVSCTYSGSLRNWLCLKNTAERWQPEACIQAFTKVASEATGLFFFLVNESYLKPKTLSYLFDKVSFMWGSASALQKWGAWCCFHPVAQRCWNL